jgi:hypothetical protein
VSVVAPSTPRVRATLLATGALALLTGVAPASARTHDYRVKLTFTQTRPWTYHYQQTAPDCTRTDDAHGLDVVKLSGTALLNAAERGVAGFGLEGKHDRTGERTHTVAVGECAASAVFPSTWSTTSEAGGTVTATEPTTNCGPKSPRTNFPTLTLVGSHLLLRWDTDPTPDFKGCPFFDGANESSSGNQLPGQAYRDVVLKVPRSQLRAGKRRVTASGTAKVAATETCANLTEPCAPGVTYDATASVDTAVNAVLTRTGS